MEDKYMMGAVNDFDLTKMVAGRVTEKHKRKPPIITSSEKARLLQGYSKVAPDKWMKLPIGSHIRYMRKDGEMRKGGYIRLITDGAIFLSNMPDIGVSNGTGWAVRPAMVSEIWVLGKPAFSSSAMIDADERLTSIEDDIAQIKTDLQNITNQQKRIVEWLSKLKNSISKKN